VSCDTQTASTVTSLDDPSVNFAITVSFTELSTVISAGGSVMSMNVT
jgi:hypothetical protein